MGVHSPEQGYQDLHSMISGLSIVSRTLISTWNKEGRLEEESRRRWMAGVGGGGCLIGAGLGWTCQGKPRQTSCSQMCVGPRNWRGLEVGLRFESFRDPKAAPHRSLRHRRSGGVTPSSLPVRSPPPWLSKVFADVMGLRPSHPPRLTNSESFLFLSPILATASDSFHSLRLLRCSFPLRYKWKLEERKCPRIILCFSI